jgi:hypothetical protein
MAQRACSLRRLTYLSKTGNYSNGKHLISIEASVPTEADASVIKEVIEIEGSVKFKKI